MLSCFSRRLLSSARRNSQLLPVSVIRNDFCTVKQSDPAETVGVSEVGVDTNNIGELLQAGNLNYVQKACSALIQINQMKNEKKITETDYKNDERFVQILKTLESIHVEKAENMLI